MQAEYRATLRLTDAQHAKLQEASDRNAATANVVRPRVRFPKGTLVRVEVQHADGGRALLQAPGRDLSEDGIGIFHNSYVHTGLVCNVTLRTVDGEEVCQTGRVARCVHLQGAVHEVGIRFENLLDMSLFTMMAKSSDTDYQLAGVIVAELQGLVTRRAAEAEIRGKVAELLRVVRAA